MKDLHRLLTLQKMPCQGSVKILQRNIRNTYVRFTYCKIYILTRLYLIYLQYLLLYKYQMTSLILVMVIIEGDSFAKAISQF